MSLCAECCRPAITTLRLPVVLTAAVAAIGVAGSAIEHYTNYVLTALVVYVAVQQFHTDVSRAIAVARRTGIG
ncbi:hypothetical protein [Halomarina pelagica]|uniref:hypothetical protein n=1 Tax=Halomarina pelagica TaxID=2961599 RepID=UPI0020C32BB2|nr:hypothetical protein [Halomarina sp. BND7]